MVLMGSKNVLPMVLLGRLRYSKGMELMAKAVARQKTYGDRDCLLVCEHEPVYTVGIRDKSYSEADEERLKRLGADFVRTDRGGLITFHGPGQLVVYPVLNLRNFGRTGSPVKWYVSIRVRNGVTSHGLALNCNTDLSWYSHIVPCGITDPLAGVTSLSVELGKPFTVETCVPLIATAFQEVFGRRVEVLEAESLSFE
ncbi:unnamed protein product [Notodromas monacha]|uniref:Octanoyl-[acyl-carrier-protein]:protein N-octanoyltransferase LIPT2, mitochondrial n=1 Tax=Notodromas monacha TaxID=399045 RepID=A0A7R9GBN1_9CRUS|nr:unnamed protein product [Notodromas monacha]CAG0916547.1 unnamed protein product [Notodromas monacha]